MPEISRFFGIIIRMYFDDHVPPHFHAIYGEHEGQVAVNPITVCVAICRGGQNQWSLNGPPFIKGS